MRKLLLYAIILFALRVSAQDSPFPSGIRRGDSIAIRYDQLIFILQRDTSTDMKMLMTKVLGGLDLKVVSSDDSVIRYANRLDGNWVRSRSGTRLTDGMLSQIQKRLSEFGAKLAPAYQMRGGLANTIFVPLPDVLIVDKKMVNADVMALMQQYGLILDEDRSQIHPLHDYFLLRNPSKVVNVYDARERIIRKLGNPEWETQIRYENLPLISSQPMSTQSASTQAVNQWDMTQIYANPQLFPPGVRVEVAVIDNGCDINSSDINMMKGFNVFSRLNDGSPVSGSAHGTKVAGIIAAKNNGVGITGVAPGAWIYPVSLHDATDGEVSDALARAINENVSVINLSIGLLPGQQGGGVSWDISNIDPTIKVAYDHDILLIAASGNDFRRDQIQYPASNPYVMAVGASDQQDNLAPMSNYGDVVVNGMPTGISVVAPGVDIVSTQLGGGVTYGFGMTSAATPHVAGLAALLKARHPELTNVMIRSIIEKSADRVGGYSYNQMTGYPGGTRSRQTGYGRINVTEAVRMADAAHTLALPAHPIVRIPVIEEIYWPNHATQPGDHDQPLTVMVNTVGQAVSELELRAIVVERNKPVQLQEGQLTSPFPVLELTRVASSLSPDPNGMWTTQFAFGPDQIREKFSSQDLDLLVILDVRSNRIDSRNLQLDVLRTPVRVEKIGFFLHKKADFPWWILLLIGMVIVIVVWVSRKN